MITKNDIQEIHPKVIELIQPGKSVAVYYGADNMNNERRHIRAIVDGKYVVYKTWSKTRQTWRYYIESMWSFHFMYIEGRLKK